MLVLNVYIVIVYVIMLPVMRRIYVFNLVSALLLSNISDVVN